MPKRYAVSIEACHLIRRKDAKALAAKIRTRLSDIDEDIYICISEYEQVKANSQRLRVLKSA